MSAHIGQPRQVVLLMISVSVGDRFEIPLTIRRAYRKVVIDRAFADSNGGPHVMRLRLHDAGGDAGEQHSNVEMPNGSFVLASDSHVHVEHRIIGRNFTGDRLVFTVDADLAGNGISPTMVVWLTVWP